MNHPLPDPLVELVAGRFRALADPTRIKILDRLHDGEATVGEITGAVGGSQQNVSKHLTLLLAAGIVARRRAGNFAYYRIADPTTLALCALVCEGLRSRAETLLSASA
jgi:DNA-binding transcriptional ArsR family regulator